MSARSSQRNSNQKKTMRSRLIKRDGKYCHYCGCSVRLPDGGFATPTTATIEHIVPLSKGGVWRLSNLVLACYACNVARKDDDHKCECSHCSNARMDALIFGRR